MQKNLKQLQEKSNKRDAKLYRAMFSSKSADACIAEKVSLLFLVRNSKKICSPSS